MTTRAGFLATSTLVVSATLLVIMAPGRYHFKNPASEAAMPSGEGALPNGEALVALGRQQVKTFTINLDLPPEKRYEALLPYFNSTVWDFWNKYFAHDRVLVDILYHVADKRGPENDEMTREIQGLVDLSKLPFKFVKAIQMLYELQTFMVPIVNFTHGFEREFPEGYEALARIPWRGPGCTGIIANNTADGTVYHARNLDFAPASIMKNLVYNGIFTKDGKEVFRSQCMAGYTMPITAASMTGENGYAIERNTRYTDHHKGNSQMLHNLFSGRPLNGWAIRKVLETETEYEGAVAAIAAAPYVSTEYAIISGVKKGTILAKDPDRVAHVQMLGQPNFEERDDYIIITNFDFFWHDKREYFDPTGGSIGKPRRIAAQKILNSSAALTPEVLFNTINAKGVIADTVFQAIINVEKKLWNISIPDV